MSFLNLSNHPLTAWSDNQCAASRALGCGEPTELAGGMPRVPATATAREVADLASEIAERALRQGALGAHVVGEPVLTYCLVRRLQAARVRCFAATTERRAEAHAPNEDEIETRRIFRFVRWREYPCD